MTLKTFFTRSFKLYALDGAEASDLSLTNAHDDVEVTDVTLELELGEGLHAEQTQFELGTLAPRQKVALTSVSRVDTDDKDVKKFTVKAHISGRVDGEDVDRETLSVDVSL